MDKKFNCMRPSMARVLSFKRPPTWAPPEMQSRRRRPNAETSSQAGFRPVSRRLCRDRGQGVVQPHVFGADLLFVQAVTSLASVCIGGKGLHRRTVSGDAGRRRALGSARGQNARLKLSSACGHDASQSPHLLLCRSLQAALQPSRRAGVGRHQFTRGTDPRQD